MDGYNNQRLLNNEFNFKRHLKHYLFIKIMDVKQELFKEMLMSIIIIIGI